MKLALSVGRNRHYRIDEIQPRHPHVSSEGAATERLVCDTLVRFGEEFIMTPSRLVVFLCAALLGSACTAPASRTAAAPGVGSDVSAAVGDSASAPATAAMAEEEDPLVCKSVARTGTRVAKRTCMRRSQAEARERAAHEMLGEIQRRGVQTGNVTKD